MQFVGEQTAPGGTCRRAIDLCNYSQVRRTRPAFEEIRKRLWVLLSPNIKGGSNSAGRVRRFVEHLAKKRQVRSICLAQGESLHESINPSLGCRSEPRPQRT